MSFANLRNLYLGDITEMRIRVCSLFAGAGGIDLGLEQAGFDIVWANEKDKDACITYSQNFPDVQLSCSDIRSVNARTIPDFDLLAAGFPCQPFSIAGKQEGFAHAKGTLFYEICRIIDIKKPKILLLENVANLIEHDHGNTFTVIKEELEKRGFFLKTAILNASDYGVPQNRKRVYIVGFTDEDCYRHFSFPEKNGKKNTVMSVIDRNRRADDSLYLHKDSWQWEAMNQAIIDTAQIYRFHENGIRRSSKGICFTLLAGMGYWPDRIPIIKDEYGIRIISPLESFLLQGFPNTFDLSKTPTQSAYRQAGNSVCVPVVRMIGEKIAEAFTLEDYDDVLVGVVRSEQQLRVNLMKNFYHFPMIRAPKNLSSIKYVALRINTPKDKQSSISYIGEIIESKKVLRESIIDLPKKSRSLYWILKVEEWKEFDYPIMNPNNLPIYVLRIPSEAIP